MTLIKSLLLGSAAGIVAVASAQAADLPTKKAAPAAEYVRICSVGGITGFVLPGSDTCLKISGYLTGQSEIGNLKDQFVLNGAGTAYALNVPARMQNMIGYSTRGQVNFDAVSNTAYGPLQAHIELQGNHGEGFDPLGNGVVINNAWLSWAGITAGKHGSFYDFLAGGEAWKDFISPDHSGGPIDLLAYTASFGGGFSATLSLEAPETVMQRAGQGVDGARSPDIVVSLDAKQGWGKAHLAGVAHLNEVTEFPGSFNEYGTWGWGVIAGLTFNLPSMGAGDNISLQAVYTKAALGYSGLLSPAWGEGDTGINTNGNGILYMFSDAVWTGTGWSTPSAWSVAASMEHHFSPQFSVSPEVSYGAISYSGSPAFISAKAEAWVGGAVFSWDPVPNLDFSLDLLYEHAHFQQPANFVPTAVMPWRSTADGFNARFRITRSF